MVAEKSSPWVKTFHLEGPITGVVELKGKIYIFTPKAMYRIRKKRVSRKKS